MIQDRRKELDCDFTDRISVALETDSLVLKETLAQHGDVVAAETLADNLVIGSLNAECVARNIAEADVQLYVAVNSSLE